jgi:competence protein ComEC
MIALAAAFTAGAWGLHQLASLPPGPWGAGVVATLLLMGIRTLRLPAALLLGFAWAGWHGHQWLERAVPGELTGIEVGVVGVISGIPDHSPRRSRFVLAVERIEEPEDMAARLGPERLRVTLFPPEPGLAAGDRIRVTLRLRPPRGLHNPSGFDFGTWLYREGLHGLGVVRGRPDVLSRAAVGPGSPGLHRLRERVRDAMLASHPGAAHAGVMQALVIGERGAMTPDEWRLFLHTGTNHLMAISGLHVGLVAGFALLLAGLLWRRVPGLQRRVSLGTFGALVAIVAAVLYAALAGFSIPTQRALIMLVLASGALLLGRDALSWRVYATAVILVVAMHPANVLAPGFWFSFGAVAVILALVRGRVAKPGPREWTSIQVILALALLPLSLAWFQLGAWVAPLANLIAVPTISLAVLPALLVGAGLAMVWTPLGTPFFVWADFWLALLLRALDGLLLVPFATSETAVSSAAAILAGVAVILLLWPRGLRVLPLAAVLCMPLFLAPSPRLAHGDFRAEMLDVGQGLAVIVQTRGHVLVYDAGPAWQGGLDAGAAVVVPALRRLGVREVDRILVSHENQDHRGGVAAVAGAFPVARILSRGQDPDTGEEACEAGTRWEWDGVEFETLHPPPFWDGGNAGSCVLAVRGPHGRLLLTGDVEGIGERVLVRAARPRLGTDVLLVPHHGASGVLSRGLLEAAAPRLAWVSRGHDNRFGHPAPDVTERLANACVPLLDTAERGMLWIETDQGGVRVGQGSRVERGRFWQPAVKARVPLPVHCSSSDPEDRLPIRRPAVAVE